MWKSYFDIQISIATFKIKKRPFTFSKPAPEASPVLTLGISSKGQVWTKATCALEPSVGGGVGCAQAFTHDVTVPRICPGSDQIFAKYQGLDPGHDLLVTPRSHSRILRI